MEGDLNPPSRRSAPPRFRAGMPCGRRFLYAVRDHSRPGTTAVSDAMRTQRGPCHSDHSQLRSCPVTDASRLACFAAVGAAHGRKVDAGR